MNGLGDVRLALCQRELLAEAQAQAQVANDPPRAGEPGESRWRVFWRRWTTRRALLDLDEAQLKDIGLTRAEARQEALRPFWTL
jgi:uncharacterized protein YjiS (DUF1127 family)